MTIRVNVDNFVRAETARMFSDLQRDSGGGGAAPPAGALMTGFMGVLRRDLLIARRQGGSSLLAVGFFVIVAVLFPFAVGADPSTLRGVAPGVIWVAALLATLLSLDRLFQADFEDGSLDVLALAPQPLFMTVLAKVLAHWLVVGLPLVAAVKALVSRLRGDPALAVTRPPFVPLEAATLDRLESGYRRIRGG